MILPDMTSEQMLKVMNGDRPAIKEFADKFIIDEGTRILRSRHTVFPCSITKYMTAPESHQRYLIIFRIATRKEAFDGIRHFYHRAIINTTYGTEVANILYHRKTDTQSIVYFRAHLFQRYAERMGLKMPADEVIRYFSKRNPMMIEATEWRKANDCMMLCNDGACFGDVNDEDPGLINLKTFIATDTMQDDSRRSHLNSTFNDALCNAMWEVYFQDPEMSDFLMKTTKRRKESKKINQ